MNKIYLLTGGNLGDRLESLKIAADDIENKIGKIIRSSRIYETGAWGDTAQPDFYNQVHLLTTALPAEKIMERILKIEETMGRVRTSKNAARIIDIDILFFNDEVVDTHWLSIPHPEIPNRRFVLEPLNEIAPNLVHPVLMKRMHELLSICTDRLPVTAV